MNLTLAEIASLVSGTVVGDNKQQRIAVLSPIDAIEAGALVYADGGANFKLAEASEAAAVLVGKDQHSSLKTLIQVDKPAQAFIQLLQHFNPMPPAKPGIHPSAQIAEGVELGDGVSIGPFVVIEAGAVIGAGTVIKSHVHVGHKAHLGQHCVIHPQVTIYDHCHLGDRVIIHASTVIGSDGFGYQFGDGVHQKIPHIGNVVIESDVEIGANTVIDRATLGSTRIGKGTKIDNLVQVAHSVKLGQHNILCAFTGIAGSSSSGDHVIFAANVGVSDHVRIDNGVILGARAGVPPKKHLLEGNIYLGNPARPRDKALEQDLSVSRIPLMRKNLKSIADKLDVLESRMSQIEES